MNRIPAIVLNDGHSIPQLGFGTWRLRGDACTDAVRDALTLGYRHIDTATLYENEEAVGRAIAESGLARDEVFVTSKVWNDRHDDVRQALSESLARLQLDHLDLYLIHWPATVQYGDSYIGCWDEMQALQREGLVTSIGVSNFNDRHVAALNGATPAINQIELHPRFNQPKLRAQMAARGIAVEAWMPLGRGASFEDDTIVSIAHGLGVHPSQVILRWHIQHGQVAIPRSANPEHIASNAEIFDIELTDEQMAAIDALDNPGARHGADPETAVFE